MSNRSTPVIVYFLTLVLWLSGPTLAADPSLRRPER